MVWSARVRTMLRWRSRGKMKFAQGPSDQPPKGIPYALGSGRAALGCAGFGPVGYGWQPPRRDAECNFAQLPYAMGSQPAEPGWPGSGRTARLAAATGRRMQFRAATPCSGEPTSAAGLAGFGPDCAAGGCGGAQNAISVQRPYGPVWWSMRVDVARRCRRMGPTERHFGKSRSNPMQLSGGLCRRVGRSPAVHRAGRLGRGCDPLSDRRMP